jgi:protein gp37
MNPQWVRSLRDQCLAEGVPFHFKQWGHWAPVEVRDSKGVATVVFKGNNGENEILARLGKGAAGRRLDGRTWDGVPAPDSERLNDRHGTWSL